MELWHHISEVWEFFVEHIAHAAGFIFGFDPKPIVPWTQLIAALLAIALSTWGLVNLWNHFDSRRRALLAEFLAAEEKKILEGKRVLAARFFMPKLSSESSDPLDVHDRLNAALSYFDKGKIIKAERELAELKNLLEERKEIALKQSQLAQVQAGAVHLFLGSIAASKGDNHKAIGEFDQAIECSGKDLDAWKYRIEQRIQLSSKEPMASSSHLDRAISDAEQMISRISPEQSDYLAEAYRLKGTSYLERGNNGNARDAFRQAAISAEKINDQSMLAYIFEKLGVAQLRMNRTIEARQAFGRSISCYENAARMDDASRVQKILDQISPVLAAVQTQAT